MSRRSSPECVALDDEPRIAPCHTQTHEDRALRWVRIIAICVILGALVNLGIAWTFVLLPTERRPFAQWRKTNEYLIREDQLSVYWILHTRQPGFAEILQSSMKWPGDWRSFARRPNIGTFGDPNLQLPAWSQCSRGAICREHELDHPGEVSQFVEVGAGWPFIAFRGEYFELLKTGPKASMAHPSVMSEYVYSSRVIFVDGTDPRVQRKRVLPWSPVLMGFALNTAAYGVVVFAVYFVLRIPFFLRSHHRKRRGRCRACGYPIGISPVCTECGRALPNEIINTED